MESWISADIEVQAVSASAIASRLEIELIGVGGETEIGNPGLRLLNHILSTKPSPSLLASRTALSGFVRTRKPFTDYKGKVVLVIYPRQLQTRLREQL